MRVVSKMILLSVTVVLFVHASVCDDNKQEPQAASSDLSNLLALIRKNASAANAKKETVTEVPPAPSSNPILKTIASWIEIIKDEDETEGKSESQTAPVAVADPVSAGSELTLDLSHPVLSNIPQFVPSQTEGWNNKKEEWTYWDWLTTDGVWFASILALFGAVPIVLGLIPYVVIALNYWVLFNKFYSLHQTFWQALGHHHEEPYGWSQYDQGGWDDGWTGWTANGWGTRQLQ
ncbi:unnamed protein product [Allacma fusca]|uniref:Uncharacterized protein n=1 Tax=Allacma fusca TaxID=39272 RepID=A0A8J2P257_9HEXA|nr:unnamed protein product [Allacma fusca]